MNEKFKKDENNKPLRGVEAALMVWSDVKKGRFASESLRRISSKVTEREKSLTASLVYALVRRQDLWWHIARGYVNNEKNLSSYTKDALMIGTAGILELRTFDPKVLVNALVDWTKKKDERGASLVNAVLRKIVARGADDLKRVEKSGALQDRALFSGIPLWIANQWESGMGLPEAKRLIELLGEPISLSLRVSPDADRSEILSRLSDGGYKGSASPILERSIRLDGTALPTALPGFEEGAITPQSESSMLVPMAMKDVNFSGPILDMCAGRGGKTGQLAQLFPGVSIEAWDISKGRVKVAIEEMNRLGIEGINFKRGDSLELEPDERPGAVFLDVPCSGSGTWRRHPEGKWKLKQEKLLEYSKIQRELLERALDLVKPGGIVLYSSCSLFREENEQVIAKVMASRKNVVELEPDSLITETARRGRPWGYYLWPETPWMDGFYMTLLAVKS